MQNELSCRPTQVDPKSPQTGPFEDIVLTPMVITKIDEEYGCVSALSMEGRWIRPEPVLTSEVQGDNPYYHYRYPFHCRIAPSHASDRRPEDRDLVEHLDLSEATPVLEEEALRQWIASHCDADVNQAFDDERSVGLVKARIERIYLQRSTRQRIFVRMVFRDPTDTSYDWIVPDVHFSTTVLKLTKDAADPEQGCAELLAHLKGSKMYLAVALTQPNNRFPGVFRGCQPLVGGVHSFPDYKPLFITDDDTEATSA